MSEPSSSPIEPANETTQGQENTRRSQRPSKPLTHKMDLRAVRAAYFRHGLIQPELEPQRSPGPHKTVTTSTQSPRQNAEVQENVRMNDQEQIPSAANKPGVAGTQHRSQVAYELDFGQKCLMNGGTALVTGTLLMLAWKGLTRWLG